MLAQARRRATATDQDSARTSAASRGVSPSAPHADVFLTNTARAPLLRVPAAATDTTHLEVVAERLFADDFAVHDDGTLYLATHTLDSVLRLAPDGRRTDIARADQGVETSTSVAIDPEDPDALWVTAAGERFGSGGHDKPARLIRLRADPGTHNPHELG
ncbi:hypothetical protein GCM10009579_74300 [Streptomyces javensis]|uniref:SMP-30/Gluconolactonase/LRE-like region domain-containing protein n=1 Tax=Streptomyces javensis TaxID=114698 RepID=A0ABP4HY79_9ACTN